MPVPPPVFVVIARRNRRESLIRVLHRLTALPEQLPLVVVVDNCSSDGTVEAITRFGSRVEVALGENRGAAARTVGILDPDR